MTLVVKDALGTVASIGDYKGPVPRIGETVYVPVGNELFSEPKTVKDVGHDFLAPGQHSRQRRFGARKTRLLVIQL